MEASRFFSLTAGAIFLAVCAYAGAAVYSRVERPEIETVSRRQVRESVELQGIVLRQEQSLSFGWGTEPLAQSGQRLASGQLMGLDGLGREILSPCSALYFSDTDGYEHLGPEDFLPGDTARLEALLDSRPGERGDGRLVTGRSWYYWAFVSGRQPLPEAGECSIEFDGMDGSLPAWIINLARDEAGQQTVLLRLNLGGSEYLSLRKTGARLLFSEYSGLYLPEAAVMQAEDGSNFVYTLRSGMLEQQPVEIIYTGSGFFLAAGGGAGGLHEGDRIAMGKDLYVGKVILP